jgi:hypothetical protein
MSEYQYVAFRAIDRPLDHKQLDFAEKQSSHSELSPREMSVEYNYGSFRGDVDGLLRRGFDVHLNYTNYGSREVKIRLPSGLPFSQATLKPFLTMDSLTWKKDTKGNGGILKVFPYLESGAIEQVWELDEYLDSLEKVRDQLIEGDLRAMYLLWLCAAYDDYQDPEEAIEPPVPHGLSKMPSASVDLLMFFGLDPLILKAAADGVPGAPARRERKELIQEFSQSISEARARALLQRVLEEDADSVRAELLTEIRDASPIMDWPTSIRGRTLDALMTEADRLREIENDREKKRDQAKAKRDAAKAEKVRQDRMVQMKSSPQSWLAQAEGTAASGGTKNYKAAAEILADLREAIGGKKGEQLAHTCAQKIAKAHPTLAQLKSALKKRGLLD